MAIEFNERELDCRGLLCPQPVLVTRDALAVLGRGRLTVLVDNEAARSNVARFAAGQGLPVEVRAESGGLFRLLISREAAPPAGAQATAGPAAAEYLCPPAGAGIIAVVASDTMGRGDDALGRVLMRAFIKTLPSLEPLPAALYFYNAGVKFTAREDEDQGLLEPLQELASRGVAIYSCGTCLDFYTLTDKLRVGEVTNMYEIIKAMAQARSIIRP